MNVYLLLLKYILGSLKLKLHGEFCERFLNLLASNNISFWNVQKKKSNFYIEVYKKDILKIKKLRRKTLVHINIVEKNGAFKIFNKYKGRYGIIAGAISFLLIINFMSNRTWVIKVTGNVKNSEAEIIYALENLGVSAGIKTNKINTDILKQRLILNLDNVSWASLNKQSSVLEVNIKEYDEEKPNYDEPCNIIALCDGIISEIKVNIGLCEVKSGQTVKAGQLLVSGIISDSGSNKAVHSIGEIYAFVPDTFKTEINKTGKRKAFTGDLIKKNTVEIFNFKLPLFLNSPKNNVDIETKTKNVTFFKRQLPIKIHTKVYKPYKNEEFIVLSSEVLSIAEERLKLKMEEENAKNYEIISCDVRETENSYVYTAKIRKTIDIAKQENLKINDEILK